MWLAAADAVDVSEALVAAVWTFLGVVVTTLGTIAVQAFRSRSDRATTGAATTPVDSVTLTRHAERIAVVEHRADDSDDRDDVQDRRHERTEDRLEALERLHDHNNPGWRNP